MSAETIYKTLRANGLSPSGACAVIGNMYCESGLIPNIAQRGMTNKTDEQYTAWADHLSNPYDFAHDGVGYGLYQLTYPSRKEGYWYFAKEHGVSVGDEKAQCEYCVLELRRDYPNLYDYLCSDCDLAKATQLVCSEFERPAVNNFADRINAARRFYNQLADTDVDTGCGEDSCPIEYPEPKPEEETCSVNVRVLHKGCLGRDVFLLQAGLFDAGYDCGIPDGDYGVNTEEAVKDLQKANSVEATGIADRFVWQTILQPR